MITTLRFVMRGRGRNKREEEVVVSMLKNP
jgi:hypothetical protein